MHRYYCGRDTWTEIFASWLFGLEWGEKWLQILMYGLEKHVKGKQGLIEAFCCIPIEEYLKGDVTSNVNFSLLDHLVTNEQMRAEKAQKCLENRESVLKTLFQTSFFGAIIFREIMITRAVDVDDDALMEEVYEHVKSEVGRTELVKGAFASKNDRLFRLISPISENEISLPMDVGNSMAAQFLFGSGKANLVNNICSSAPSAVVGSTLLLHYGHELDLQKLFEAEQIHPFVLFVALRIRPSLIKLVDKQCLEKVLLCDDEYAFLPRLLYEMIQKNPEIERLFAEVFKSVPKDALSAELMGGLFSFGLIQRVPREFVLQDKHFWWNTKTHPYVKQEVRNRAIFLLILFKRIKVPKQLAISIISRCVNAKWYHHIHALCPKHGSPERVLNSI